MTPQPKSQPQQTAGPKPTAGKNQTTTAAPMTPSVSGYMPPHMPFMDPYMYYQMAAAHQSYGYPFQPYGMQTPYGMPYPAPGGSLAGGVRQLQDDQMSMHSYRYDIDNRSEKKLNLSERQPTLNNSNLNSNNIKSELKDNRTSLHGAGLLLMQSNKRKNIKYFVKMARKLAPI